MRGGLTGLNAPHPGKGPSEVLFDSAKPLFSSPALGATRPLPIPGWGQAPRHLGCLGPLSRLGADPSHFQGGREPGLGQAG